MELKINEELKALIPPLTDDEYRLLEQSIIKEGCRDKLITWDDTIVDGHNRYEICKKHGIPFQTEDRDFEDIVAVRIWMRNNALGNRNLTPAWKIDLELANKEDLKKTGMAKQSPGTNQYTKRSVSPNDTDQKYSTRKEIAKRAGTSTGSVGMAEQVKKKNPELWEKAKTGDIGISTAYKKIKSQENIEERKRKESLQTKQNSQTVSIIKKMPAMDFIDTINEADLLLTDPPYFTDGDFTKEISYALSKVKESGQAYVFAGAYPDEMNAYLNINTHHMELCQILVWNYNNTGQRQPNVRYTSNYQVCFYYRGKDAPNINKPADGKEQYACQTINAPDGRLGDRYHKWQKPNELIQRLIRNSTKENDLIFDPFAGSGSTLINAAILGRLGIGSDIDDEAVKICIERGCNHEL